MSNFKRYTGLGLLCGSIVLTGSLMIPRNIPVRPHVSINKPTVEEYVETKDIQQIPCLSFSSPVEAFKVVKTEEKIIVGYQDEQPIYDYKYIPEQLTTVECVIEGSKMVGVEIPNENGKSEIQYQSIYVNAEDGSFVAFPNGVITKQVVETVSTEYETTDGTVQEEIPEYEDILSFTTGETVTKIMAEFEITEEGMHLVNDIHAYIPAR